MDDERTVPALVSVYKAEVWRHWAFVVMSAPGPQCGRHLSSAACRIPCEKPSLARGAAGGRVAARLQLSLVLGAFCAVGVVLALRSRRFHAEHKYKLKNLWNPSWKVLRMFNICIYFFTFVLFSLGIQQAIYFSLILSRCNFLFRSKCLSLLKKKKILYMHLSKESSRHLNFSPLTRTAQKVVQ